MSKFFAGLQTLISNLKNITSIVLCIVILIAVVFAGKLAWNNHQLSSLTNLLNNKLQQADLKNGKAETQIINDNIKIDQLSKDLQKEVVALNSKVSEYAKLEAEYKASQSHTGNADVNYQGDSISCIGVTPGLYESTVKDKIVSIKSIDGSLTDNRLSISCNVLPQDKIPMTISYKLDLKLRADILEVISPTGATNHLVDIYEVDKDGKDVDKLELLSYKVIERDLQAPHWMLFSPHLDVGGVAGLRGLNPDAGLSIGLSLSAYGKSSADSIWRFARFSFDIDLDKNLGIGLTPFAYDVSKLGIPWTTNIWAGPHLSHLFGSGNFIGLYIGVGL